jgi:hypothetical protein
MQDLKRQLDQKAAQLSVRREIGRAINAAWELQATLMTADGNVRSPARVYREIEAQSLAVLK